MTNPAIATQSEQSPIQVARKDLPLSCPRPEAPVWNMHPRVYLPIEDAVDQTCMCPYCGARYQLVD